MIKLCVEGTLGRFYKEAEEMLAHFLASKYVQLPSQLLHEAIDLNRNLIKLPCQTEDLDLTLSYNIGEFYQSVLVGVPIPLENRECTYHINRTGQIFLSWEDWFRDVIWYGTKKGAYLYGNNLVERQIEGHF